jgi:hypothetical protein
MENNYAINANCKENATIKVNACEQEREDP